MDEKTEPDLIVLDFVIVFLALGPHKVRITLKVINSAGFRVENCNVKMD